jgi:hypothetical protein
MEPIGLNTSSSASSHIGYSMGSDGVIVRHDGLQFAETFIFTKAPGVWLLNFLYPGSSHMDYSMGSDAVIMRDYGLQYAETFIFTKALEFGFSLAD